MGINIKKTSNYIYYGNKNNARKLEKSREENYTKILGFDITPDGEKTEKRNRVIKRKPWWNKIEGNKHKAMGTEKIYFIDWKE